MTALALNRRRFLHALGAGALAGGLGPQGLISSALAVPAAQSPVAPILRFIGVYTPHGRAHELWQPGPGFDLTYPDCSLAPFDDATRFGRSFKDRLLVIDGVDLSAGIAAGTVGHEGARVILTGSGANGKNPSLDQYLAVDRMLGDATPHTTLALGIGFEGTERGSNISYSSGGTPIPKLVDPEKTFDELFGSAITGAPTAELRAKRARAESVLDFLRDDLSNLRLRAPGSERLKLDQHQTALREIEKRLAPQALQCDLPARPDRATFPKLLAFGGGEPYFELITDLQIDLLARALACDLTRFSTLFLADLTRTGLVPGLPVDVHSDVAHRYRPRTSNSPGDPTTWLPLARQNRHSYAKVARLMQRLDDAGILEDSVIYVSSDMGDPALHSSRHVPTLIAGGCGGKFKLGRYLDLRPRGIADTKPANGKPTDVGCPNNRILVSICEAFGIDTARFGDTSVSIASGGLDALFA